MEFVNFLFAQIQAFYNTLNQYTFGSAPIGIMLVAFVLTSMVISVFWKGARG